MPRAFCVLVCDLSHTVFDSFLLTPDEKDSEAGEASARSPSGRARAPPDSAEAAASAAGASAAADWARRPEVRAKTTFPSPASTLLGTELI